MGVASLVLGIIAIVCSIFLGGFNFVGSIVGVVGIILGALGRKDPEKKGIATAGLVCSIIGFILGIILTIACVVCIGAAGTAAALW